MHSTMHTVSYIATGSAAHCSDSSTQVYVCSEYFGDRYSENFVVSFSEIWAHLRVHYRV